MAAQAIVDVLAAADAEALVQRAELVVDGMGNFYTEEIDRVDGDKAPVALVMHLGDFCQGGFVAQVIAEVEHL